MITQTPRVLSRPLVCLSTGLIPTQLVSYLSNRVETKIDMMRCHNHRLNYTTAGRTRVQTQVTRADAREQSHSHSQSTMIPDHLSPSFAPMTSTDSLSYSDYKFHPLIYTGEIGQISDYASRLITLHPSQEDVIRESPDLCMYKYGITSNIHRRSRENNRQFKYFDIKLLKGSIRHMEIEKCITEELKHKNLLFKIMMNGRTKREIVCFTEEWQKDWYIELIDDLIRRQYTNHIFVSQNRWET